MTILTLIFFFLVGLIGVIYVGYPALLRSGLLGARQKVHSGTYEAGVSIIVPAHNEQNSIEAKILNLLALDYPKEKMEILIGSDGSSDQTEEIVGSYVSSKLRLIANTQQCGKSGMQNALVAAARGEILIFTDADCLLARDAIRELMDNFADPKIGLVTCKPSYSNSAETEICHNESIYLRYENWIRREESSRGLLAAASGWFFGIRRELWHILDPNVGDDFVLPLGTVLQGFRNIVDERIGVSTPLSQKHISSMFGMKMRIISKDLRGLFANRAILNPFQHGRVAVGLWLHKLLRWLVPYFLLIMLAVNVFLLANVFFQLVFLIQIAFYAFALCGWLLGEQRVRAPWSIPLSFCLVNAAAFAGVLYFTAGKKMGRWKPVRSGSGV